MGLKRDKIPSPQTTATAAFPKDDEKRDWLVEPRCFTFGLTFMIAPMRNAALQRCSERLSLTSWRESLLHSLCHLAHSLCNSAHTCSSSAVGDCSNCFSRAPSFSSSTPSLPATCLLRRCRGRCESLRFSAISR